MAFKIQVMSEHTFHLGQRVATVKQHTWRVKGADYVVAPATPATVVDFGRYSNDPHIEFEDGVRVTTDPKLISAISQNIVVNKTFTCTQRELVFDIAQKIHGAIWTTHQALDSNDLFTNQQPKQVALLNAAETIFELFLEQSPTYSDDQDT